MCLKLHQIWCQGFLEDLLLHSHISNDFNSAQSIHIVKQGLSKHKVIFYFKKIQKLKWNSLIHQQNKNLQHIVWNIHGVHVCHSPFRAVMQCGFLDTLWYTYCRPLWHMYHPALNITAGEETGPIYKLLTTWKKNKTELLLWSNKRLDLTKKKNKRKKKSPHNNSHPVLVNYKTINSVHVLIVISEQI